MKNFFPLLLICSTIWACTEHTTPPHNVELSSGRIERFKNFDSKYVAPRNIDVWLPEDYTTDRKYSVLYMHDGQMLFDATTTWNKQEWGVDETMEQLIASGDIRESIVVGIWNTADRHAEYFPQKPFESLPVTFQDSLLSKEGKAALFTTDIQSDNYLRFIVEELKPFVDDKYATLTEVQHTFIAGSSMGGLISMYALCEYPKVFGRAACLSTHWVGTFDTLNNPIPAHFATYLDEHLPNPQNHKLYFDYGTETLDALYAPYQIIVDSILVRHNYTTTQWKTLKFVGAEHSEVAWQKRLDIPFKFILGQ